MNRGKVSVWLILVVALVIALVMAVLIVIFYMRYIDELNQEIGGTSALTPSTRAVLRVHSVLR